MNEAWKTITFEGEQWEVANHPGWGVSFRSPSDADWHCLSYFGKAIDAKFAEAMREAAKGLRTLKDNEQ